MPSKRSVLPGLALALVLVAGACAGPDEDDDATGTDPGSETSSETGSETTPSDDASASAPSGEETSLAEVTSEPAEEPTESEPAGPSLDVTIEGDDVSPNAEELELGTGEPLTLVITSDRAGELHVHSKPEQYVEFDAGTSEHELVVDTPGEVEVEEHDSNAVLALIEVS